MAAMREEKAAGALASEVLLPGGWSVVWLAVFGWVWGAFWKRKGGKFPLKKDLGVCN